MKNRKNLLPLNLQFFAEDDSDAKEKNANDESNNGGKNEGDQSTETGEKTFTQSQVSAMMAKEKKEGKKSILKSLGFDSEEDAKDAFNLLKALKDSQKSEEQKNKDDKDKAVNELNEANNRAAKAESKLTCLENGVNKDSLDDILAIASLKVTDDKNLEAVIKEMKKDKKYNSFFENSSSSGTGSNPGHSGGSESIVGDYGKRLAEKTSADKKEEKHSFFD